MNLLKGEVQDFNLGEEDDVTTHKYKYLDSPFKDVSNDAWYTLFVTYCHREGVVSGFNDGTFRPDDYGSEKAFLAMLLQSMGDKVDEDFS